MFIAIAVLIAALATTLSVRALWRARHTGDWGTIFAVLAAAMVVGLAFLAATGRLNWIAAVAAAFVPFVRRLLGLLQYIPIVRRFLGAERDPPDRERPAGSAPGQGTELNRMNRERAIEILGLGPQPTRAEVIDAHRRLMQKLHPDRGGTTYFAQLLNEAKGRLLDDQD